MIEYWLKDKPQGEVTLEIPGRRRASVNKYSSQAVGTRRGQAEGIAEQEVGIQSLRRRRHRRAFRRRPGMNRFIWDLHYPDATMFPNMILWAGSTRGPMVVPGNYQVQLTVDGKTQTQSFTVVKDPRLKTTTEDFNRQLALALQIRDKLSQTNQAVIDIREAKKQLGRIRRAVEGQSGGEESGRYGAGSDQEADRGGRGAVPGEESGSRRSAELSHQAEQPDRRAAGRGRRNRRRAHAAIERGL